MEQLKNPHIFSEEEIQSVLKKFPKLKLEIPGIWKGVVDVFHTYQGHEIKDSFEVVIVTIKGYPAITPFVIEIGGRTKSISQKHGINDLRDLHCSQASPHIICLCAVQEEREKFPPGSNLVVFIENLVIPYLYGLSYFEKNGKWAPWGERSHGPLGILESHAEFKTTPTELEIKTIIKILRTDPNWKKYSKYMRVLNSEKFCLCGKRKPINKCHELAFKGLKSLNENISALGLHSRNLFDSANKEITT